MTRPFLAALALAFGSLALPGARAGTISTFDDSGIEIRYTLGFEQAPRAGYVPARIVITNRTDSAKVWQVMDLSKTRYMGGTTQSFTRDLKVEAGGRGQFDVLLPIVPTPTNSSGQPPPAFSISGPGVESGGFHLNGANSSGGTQTAYIAMSPALATPSWAFFEQALKDKGGHTLTGSPIGAIDLFTDWRAWLGVDALWMTGVEYAALPAEPRRALREWLLQGGQLFLCLADGETSPVELGLDVDTAVVGLGKVRMIPWDGKELPLDAAVASIKEMPVPLGDALNTDYSERTPFVKELGRLPFNVALLTIFVVVFAITVGPLNVLWFARAGRRQRLFWTTPLISVIASLMLAGLIVLQDGFGGAGSRVALRFLMSAEKRAVVMQEQAARTGLLFSRDFKLSESAFMAPIVINGRAEPSRTLEQVNDTYRGGWFASRAIQAHYLQAIVPTREAVELLNPGEVRLGEAPVVLSSIAQPLDEFLWIDDAGGAWRASGVKAGQRVTLEPAGDRTFDPAKETGAGALIARACKNAIRRPGYFYAVSRGGPFLETLRSIRWKNDQTIYLGPIQRSP